MEIYPSLISSDLLKLHATLQQLDDYCDGYHLDVMDDHFVPNLTWGPDFINAIIEATQKPVHVHLMVQDPTRWVKRLKLRSFDLFIFHYESLKQPEKIKNLLEILRDNTIHTSIALNPETPISVITDFLQVLDQILIMSVNPGFSGQAFIPDVTEKIASLVTTREDKDLAFKISMDGGISEKNIRSLVTLGVDQVAIASAIFGDQNPVSSIQKLYELCK